MQNRKLDIVQRLLADIPDALRESIDHAMITWWTNIRSDGGLRLTTHGYKIMHDILKIESWYLDIPNGQPITKRTLLDMDRKLSWPYYVDSNVRKKRRRVIFFSSQEAMMATIYGDLDSWLRSL